MPSGSGFGALSAHAEAGAAGAPALSPPCGGAPPIAVRPLSPADFDTVKAAHAQLFPIDYDDGFYQKATHGLDRIFSWGAFVQGPGGGGGCSGGGEELIGFVTARMVRLHECDTQDRHLMGLVSLVLDHDCVVYILTLGVLDAWRGRGIASRLIGFVTQHAAEARCRAVFLHVITYNDAAIRLYSRASFTCAGAPPGAGTACVAAYAAPS
ncbi:MAG: acyl-CoA N-acyltransferase [Monoraphidium minutum]|nr:MAG: acyl-CoA N-acyltransferase [Monoraphidium minutum]